MMFVCKMHQLFCLDRMGIVGEDGATHNGVFAVSLLRCLPNMKIMLPKDGQELEDMLSFSMGLNGPVSLCYPKETVPDHLFEELERPPIALGKAEVLKKGKGVAILAIGSMVSRAWEAVSQLEQERLSPTLVNLRFVKPLDVELLVRN